MIEENVNEDQVPVEHDSPVVAELSAAAAASEVVESPERLVAAEPAVDTADVLAASQPEADTGDAAAVAEPEADTADVVSVAPHEPEPAAVAAAPAPPRKAGSGRKPVANKQPPAPAVAAPKPTLAAATGERGRRKVRQGRVVSDKMEKTVIVLVETRVRHPLYGKIMRQSSRLYAHDELASAAGDTVEVMETRPLSKLKRWRVTRIVERAK
ncbi:MAG: 30S ribosomal protein S17 [Armatimonadetes bacterium]|nr:30S ribosomal protein S17 [Armatimonadota bacterium]MDE2206876.1 30S ribosomal protein S17 [Armatimonadota bacterium]